LHLIAVHSSLEEQRDDERAVLEGAAGLFGREYKRVYSIVCALSRQSVERLSPFSKREKHRYDPFYNQSVNQFTDSHPKNLYTKGIETAYT
jgi:hypothetical protein